MAVAKKKKTKKVVKGTNEEVNEETTQEETAESSLKQGQEFSGYYQATLLMGREYHIGGMKFRKGIPTPVKDPELVKDLQVNSAFSIVKI